MLELSLSSFSNRERVFAKTCPFTPSSLPVNDTSACLERADRAREVAARVQVRGARVLGRRRRVGGV